MSTQTSLSSEHGSYRTSNQEVTTLECPEGKSGIEERIECLSYVVGLFSKARHFGYLLQLHSVVNNSFKKEGNHYSKQKQVTNNTSDFPPKSSPHTNLGTKLSKFTVLNACVY